MTSSHTNEGPNCNENARNFDINHTSEFATNMVFKTNQDLIEWVQNLGRSLGYVIVIKQTKKKPSGWVSKTTLMCDRSGIYKSNKTTGTSEFATNMVFKTNQDLIEWVQNLGRSLGYVIVIKQTKKKPSGWVSKTTLMCDRSGIYKSNKTTSRNTKSRKTNCPFLLIGKHSKLYGNWTLQVVCEKHNHEPSLNMEGHPYAMRLSDQETRLVVDLMKKNMKPLDILSTLKEQNKDNLSSIRTIYNTRQKYRREIKEANVPSATLVCDTTLQNTVCESQNLKDKLLRDNQIELPTEKPTRQRSCKEYHPCSYINQLPNMFLKYITQVQDVKSDGNCGFRAIAVCLGLHEDAWPKIRFDLMEELNTHRTEYDEIFGRESRLQLHKALNFFRSDIAAASEHWMTLPDMGILIASRYNVILHCLSVEDSMTYLPLGSTPPPWYQHVAIAIGHVNDDHYVKLELQGGYPMPPVVPQWFHFRHACASAWVTPYINRLKMYVTML